jgi:ppGpp synthetase/RelA/SpoT-type nucleotidyltranferase
MMKKPFKRVLQGIGILITIFILFAVVLFIRLKSASKGMNPTETKEIINNIYAVNNGYVSFHLIRDSDLYVAVDAGNDLDVVAAELKKLNIDPDKCRGIEII